MKQLQDRTQDEWDQEYADAKTRYDIVSVVESYGVALRKIGSWWVAPCPFSGHRGKNKSNFNIKTNSQTFACRSCGKSGDVLAFVCLMQDLPHSYAAIRFLGNGFVPTPVTYTPKPIAPVIPLDTNENDPYHRALMQSPSALRLWQKDGVSLSSILQYQLGYCKSKAIYCSFHERAEMQETLTIPIFQNGKLVNIRHRILNPCNPHDKYRPEKAGQGLALFNSDVLDISANTDDVLLVAGEKKVIVLQQYLGSDFLPIISSTGGCSSWYGQYATLWTSLLVDRTRIYIGFDPGEEKAAQRTAMLFGRRAYLVEFPMKPDDIVLLPNGIQLVFDAIGDSEALRSKSVWL